MKFSATKYFLVLVAILAMPATIHFEHAIKARKSEVHVEAPKDPRAVRLHAFLTKLHCPVKDLAEEFVHAADDNNLDWRLLPSIAVIESSGGKTYKNNNVFGWANGDHSFPTVRAGLHRVAFALGQSSTYRNRTTEEKLRLYNPTCDYPARVEQVMHQISPEVELQAAAYRKPFRNPIMGFLAQN